MADCAAEWLRLDDIQRRRVNLLLASFRQLHGISHFTMMIGELPLAVVHAVKLPQHLHEIRLPLRQNPNASPSVRPSATQQAEGTLPSTSARWGGQAELGGFLAWPSSSSSAGRLIDLRGRTMRPSVPKTHITTVAAIGLKGEQSRQEILDDVSLARPP